MYKGYYISCQTPYGYKVNPNNKTQLIVDEEVKDNVKLIFELSLMNLGSKSICNELNRRGIPTPGAATLCMANNFLNSIYVNSSWLGYWPGNGGLVVSRKQ